MTKLRNKNAVTHGIFARILLTGNPFGDDRAHFLDLVVEFRESIRPANGLELALVEKLAMGYLRLARFYRADLNISNLILDRALADLRSAKPLTEVEFCSREDQAMVVAKPLTVDTLIRYNSNIEKQIERTLNQIEAARRIRMQDPFPGDPKPLLGDSR